MRSRANHAMPFAASQHRGNSTLSVVHVFLFAPVFPPSFSFGANKNESPDLRDSLKKDQHLIIYTFVGGIAKLPLVQLFHSSTTLSSFFHVHKRRPIIGRRRITVRKTASTSSTCISARYVTSRNMGLRNTNWLVKIIIFLS